MTKEQEKKENRLLALGREGARDPHFKEKCRNTGDPFFFTECEQKIEELKKVKNIEIKCQKRDSIKFLDISEISLEGSL